MKKVLFTFVAVASAAAGIIFLYFALTSLNDGGNILYFMGSFALIGAAIYVFMMVTKDPSAQPTLDLPPVSAEQAQASLTKKTAMVNQYGKINNARKKLKILEAAGNAEQEALS